MKCAYTTKFDRQCTRNVKDDSFYCWQHKIKVEEAKIEEVKIEEVKIEVKTELKEEIKEEKEIWKEIPGCPGYKASTLGNIEYPTGRNPDVAIRPDGYSKCSIYDKQILIHRLVAITFLENPSNKPIVDHINRIRTDNRLKNLRWVTAKENAKNTNHPKTRKNSHIKVIQYDLEGNELEIWDSMVEASTTLKVDLSHMTKVCRGKLNHTGGFKWKYYIDNIEGEEWKEVQIDGTKVKVSNKGRYQDLNDHFSFGGKRVEYLTMIINGKYHQIHRIICFAFNPKNQYKSYDEYEDLQVNHKNLNKYDNTIENLEWCTGPENIRHAKANISRKDKPIYNSIKIERLDLEGNVIKTYSTVTEARKDVACRSTKVHEICSDNSIYAGSRWRYAKTK